LKSIGKRVRGPPLSRRVILRKVRLVSLKTSLWSPVFMRKTATRQQPRHGIGRQLLKRRMIYLCGCCCGHPYYGSRSFVRRSLKLKQRRTCHKFQRIVVISTRPWARPMRVLEMPRRHCVHVDPRFSKTRKCPRIGCLSRLRDLRFPKKRLMSRVAHSETGHCFAVSSVAEVQADGPPRTWMMPSHSTFDTPTPWRKPERPKLRSDFAGWQRVPPFGTLSLRFARATFRVRWSCLRWLNGQLRSLHSTRITRLRRCAT